MATPQESTTTVSGRRCTRSRARTAATSSLTSSAAAVVTPTEFTSTSQAAQQIQSSAAQAPPPNPPSSSTQAAQQASSTEAASSAIAVTSISSLPDSTSTSAILAQSSVAALPEQSGVSAQPSDSSSNAQPNQPQSTETGIPSGGSAGVISPDQGTPEGNGLTLPADGQTNVASIAGGVVGGFVGLALVSALLFFCLRRRRTGTFERWQQRMSEKSSGDGGFAAKIRAIPEKLKAVPAGIGMFVAKIKGNKSGPSSNPYRRHTIRSSVSSVYSTRSNGRISLFSERSVTKSSRERMVR